MRDDGGICFEFSLCLCLELGQKLLSKLSVLWVFQVDTNTGTRTNMHISGSNLFEINTKHTNVTTGNL